VGLIRKIHKPHEAPKPHCSSWTKSILKRFTRLCRFEQMESRQLLSVTAPPVHLGATYFEEANPYDAGTGNVFEISFNGGAKGTQLTELTINADKYGDGLKIGDVFFDTAAGGIGAYGSSPFKIVSKTGIDSVTADVVDGGTQLVLHFTGFDAGEKLTFTIDVDEQGFLGPNAVAEGNEFEGSTMTGKFSAPHYAEAVGTDMFVDFYDSKLNGTGLALPPDAYDTADAYVPPGAVGAGPVYTAGAIFPLQQTPLPITISGNVYADPNANNHHDSGESGIGGVTLSLFELVDGSYVATGKTAVTDANGHYKFDGVLPSTYRIVETQPANYLSVGDAVGTVNGQPRGVIVTVDILSEINMDGGEDSINNDFFETLPATLSGHVYFDANNNGHRDAGETAIGGVTVQLLDANGNPLGQTATTDSTGYFQFTSLMPGTYGVRETQPSGYFDGLDAAGTLGGTAHNPGDLIDGVHLLGGQNGQNYDFGELLPCSLSGRVFLDYNGNAAYDAGDTLLTGVTIRLLDGSGNLVTTTTTDDNGDYSFIDLAPGVYSVAEAQPDGYLQGDSLLGSLGGTRVSEDLMKNITIPSGVDAVRYDFYEVPPASLAGFVYADDNNNGIFEDSESGIGGATVTLLDASGNSTGLTTVTDSTGFYNFTNLRPGTYGVRETQPTDYLDGLDTAGTVGGAAHNPGDLIDGVTLGGGVNAKNYNFGEIRPASLAGFVYADDNNNGIFEDSESGIGGVTVTLLDASGNSTGLTTVTDSTGFYSFTNLRPGTYGVRETQPSAYFDGLDTAGTVGGTAHNPGDLIDAIVLPAGVKAKNYDFGEIRPASLSGKVFLDANGNDTYDSGETLISGVTMYLTDALGNRVATAVTDQNGYYEFRKLTPGTYSVEEVQPAGYLEGSNRVGSAGGTLNSPDHTINISLGPDVNGVNYDFWELLPAKISGYVFQDGPVIKVKQGDPTPDIPSVRDGKLTDDDTRLSGVTLKLCDGLGNPLTDDSGNEITTTTDANGYYEFDNLQPGLYSVVEVQPTGYVQGVDTVGNLGGVVVNSYTAIPADMAGILAVDPEGSSIVQIQIDAGSSGTQYNFSEVKLETVPPWDPPMHPDNPTPPDIPRYFPYDNPGSIHPPHAPTPIVLNLPFGGGAGGPGGTTWHLSVINGGQPRQNDDGTEFSMYPPTETFDPATWKGEDLNQQGEWMIADESGSVTHRRFGLPGGTPVVGDWNGDGVTKIGVFRDGEWFMDLDGNGLWDEGDLWAKLGDGEDQPVAGDWDGDGKDDIGIFGMAWIGDTKAVESDAGLPTAMNPPKSKYKNVPPDPARAAVGFRTMKRTHAGKIRSDLIDHVFEYGTIGDRAVVGDWNGDGIKKIGVFRGGVWYLDIDGDGRWSAADVMVHFGREGDAPVAGDWTGDGITKLGVYRNGTFLLDTDNNRQLDATDRVFELGSPGDKPFAGHFHGKNVDTIGVYHESVPSAARAKVTVPATTVK
jgi:serine-aspartate repeat-containing protein C/D/E